MSGYTKRKPGKSCTSRSWKNDAIARSIDHKNSIVPWPQTLVVAVTIVPRTHGLRFQSGPNPSPAFPKRIPPGPQHVVPYIGPMTGDSELELHTISGLPIDTNA